ncbi:Uu.00g044670.m01.CDS01 [Anthostomella pinea]|uniref:Uu.00g044670.m01.CDS01 n=1 Tax=Anthostomella pinea TaxID=933095 RepID=A0AAI8YBX9_9PEZI|nr:Uu.00g044670.m01.CDS01 [Anthostomella pinea]
MAPRENEPSDPSDRHPTDQPAKEGVRGVVRHDGKFECHEERPGGTCYSVMTNKAHIIISHLSSVHKAVGKYLENEAKKTLPSGDPEESWPCHSNPRWPPCALSWL